ncbi:SPOPL.2 family protein [Megaselia abdita]
MQSKYNIYCDIQKVYEQIKEDIVIPCKNISTSIVFDLTYSREDTFIRLICEGVASNILKFNKLKARCDFYDCEVVLYTNIDQGMKKYPPSSLAEITLLTENNELYSISNGKLLSKSQQCFEIICTEQTSNFELELYQVHPKINKTIKGCVTKQKNNIPWVEFCPESAAFLENEEFKYYEMIYRKKESFIVDFDENFSVAFRTKAPLNVRLINNDFKVILVVLDKSEIVSDLSPPKFKYIENERSVEELTQSIPFKSFYLNDEHSDLRIESHTTTFPAHKIVLSNISPVFAANFRNCWIESQTHTLKICDLSEAAVRQLLYFTYTGNLDYHKASDCLVDLFIGACKYQMSGLIFKCVAVAACCLKEDLVEELMEAACLHDCNEMIGVISDYVEETHMDMDYHYSDTTGDVNNLIKDS